MLDSEIFWNKGKILEGNYERLPQSTEVIKLKSGLDNYKPKDLIIKHYGKDLIKEAVKKFNSSKDGCTNCLQINQK